MTDWKSIALFFNLADDVVATNTSSDPVRLRNYQRTTSNSALKFLDLGSSPATIPASEFLNRYWLSLTRGQLDFGFDTARDDTGRPLVPTLRPPGNDPDAWGGLIDLYLARHAEKVWQAAGGRSITSSHQPRRCNIVSVFDLESAWPAPFASGLPPDLVPMFLGPLLGRLVTPLTATVSSGE